MSSETPRTRSGVLRWGVVVAGVVLVAVVSGVAGFTQARSVPTNAHLSCAGTAKVVSGYLRTLAAAETRVDEDEIAGVQALSQGYQAVAEALLISECEPGQVVRRVDLPKLGERGVELWNMQLAQVALMREFADLPDRAVEIKSLLDRENEPNPRAAVSLDGVAVVLFVAEEAADCECFDDALLFARTQGVKAAVVASGPTAWGLQASHPELEPLAVEDVDLTQLPAERPGVAVVRDGRVRAWLGGVDRVQQVSQLVEAVTDPLDHSAERVPEEWLYGAGRCDGNTAKGVVFNASDRPVHIAVGTDPAVEFDTDGLVVSRKRWHDLGVVEGWGSITFEVATGEPFYAPCALHAAAVFADGEMRGTEYEPGDSPPGFPEGPEEAASMLDREGLPTQIQPAGPFPSPEDVTPVG